MECLNIIKRTRMNNELKNNNEPLSLYLCKSYLTVCLKKYITNAHSNEIWTESRPWFVLMMSRRKREEKNVELSRLCISMLNLHKSYRTKRVDHLCWACDCCWMQWRLVRWKVLEDLCFKKTSIHIKIQKMRHDERAPVVIHAEIMKIHNVVAANLKCLTATIKMIAPIM